MLVGHVGGHLGEYGDGSRRSGGGAPTASHNIKPGGAINACFEHDQSYKQGESPRYQGRDVAVYRAFQEKTTVILGSATPSIESWQNSRTGKYHLLELPSRALTGAKLPEVELLDLRQQPRQSGCYFFTKELVEAL